MEYFLKLNEINELFGIKGKIIVDGQKCTSMAIFAPNSTGKSSIKRYINQIKNGVDSQKLGICFQDNTRKGKLDLLVGVSGATRPIEELKVDEIAIFDAEFLSNNFFENNLVEEKIAHRIVNRIKLADCTDFNNMTQELRVAIQGVYESIVTDKIGPIRHTGFLKDIEDIAKNEKIISHRLCCEIKNVRFTNYNIDEIKLLLRFSNRARVSTAMTKKINNASSNKIIIDTMERIINKLGHSKTITIDNLVSFVGTITNTNSDI